MIGFTRLDHLIKDHQNAVTNGHGRFLVPTSGTNPPILFAQVGLGMGGGMGGLNKHAFGPTIAFACAATLFFACRFMVARTNADPGRGMSGIWEVLHVPA